MRNKPKNSFRQKRNKGGFCFFTIALLSAGAENFASVVAAREGRRESTVTMETSIPVTHTANPLRTHLETKNQPSGWSGGRTQDGLEEGAWRRRTFRQKDLTPSIKSGSKCLMCSSNISKKIQI